MIRHCILLRLRDGADPTAVDACIAALRELPGRIAAIRSYEVGPDLGWRDGNADLAVVASFDDEAGWRAYVEHPDHVAVVESHLVPLVESRQSVQFTI